MLGGGGRGEQRDVIDQIKSNKWDQDVFKGMSGIHRELRLRLTPGSLGERVQVAQTTEQHQFAEGADFSSKQEVLITSEEPRDGGVCSVQGVELLSPARMKHGTDVRAEWGSLCLTVS